MFRVGVPADIIYTLIIDSSSSVESMTCLPTASMEALEFFAADTTGASLPSAIQDALDLQEKEPQELICGAYTCGEESDLISTAQTMHSAYLMAAYRCIHSDACDEYDHAYLVDGQATYETIANTFGSDTTAPTCQAFASAMAGAILLSGCKKIKDIYKPDCTTSTTCLATRNDDCPDEYVFSLDAYIDASGDLTTNCKTARTCTPPSTCTFDEYGNPTDLQVIETPNY